MVDPRMSRFALPVAAFAAMTAIVMATGAVLFARKLGLGPEQVQRFYLGSEAAFTQPRSLAGLLEVAVPHLLAVPLVLFVTLHLVAFARGTRRRPFAVASAVTWGAAAVGLLAGFAIRFAAPAIAPVKIAAFVALEATMAGWLALLAASLVPAREPASPEAAPRSAAPDPLTGSEAAPPRAAR